MTHEELVEALKEQIRDLPDDCSRYMDFALRKSDIEMLIAALENAVNCDVPTKKVKRWETYNGDFVKAYTEWRDNKRLCMSKSVVPDDCRKYTQCSECYNGWLMEEIEVEE